MSNVNGILDMIKKLHAKATGEGVTEAEANLFADKVQELLAKHNLDMADLQDEEATPVNSQRYESPYCNVGWRSRLFSATAKLYFCKMYRNLGQKLVAGKWTSTVTAFTIVGKEHNRAIALSMYEYFCAAIVRLSRNYSSKPAERYHFEKGCAVRLVDRILAKVEEMTAPAPVATSATALRGSGLPALYSQELALVDQFMEGVKLKSARRTSTNISNNASLAGYNAGNSISLNGQVGGGFAAPKLGNTKLLS